MKKSFIVHRLLSMEKHHRWRSEVWDHFDDSEGIEKDRSKKTRDFLKRTAKAWYE